MCGLFGMILPHRYPTDLLRRDAALAFLGVLAEERGRHGAGIAAKLPTADAAGRRVGGEAAPRHLHRPGRAPAAPRTRRRHGGDRPHPLGHPGSDHHGQHLPAAGGDAARHPQRRPRRRHHPVRTGVGRSVVDRLPGRLPGSGHRPHPWAGQHPTPGHDPGRDARSGRAGVDRHRRHDRPRHGSGLAGPRRAVAARDRPRRRRRPVVGLQPRVAAPAELDVRSAAAEDRAAARGGADVGHTAAVGGSR